MFSACHPEQREASAFPGAKSRSFAVLRMTVTKGDCESYNPAHDDAAISFFYIVKTRLLPSYQVRG